MEEIRTIGRDYVAYRYPAGLDLSRKRPSGGSVRNSTGRGNNFVMEKEHWHITTIM
jgi:hypothetical protein